MVKARQIPFALAVTGLTFATERSFVVVVFEMAGHASGGSLDLKRVDAVARLAFERRMAIPQRKMGLAIMAKAGLFPARVLVAMIALITHVAMVCIVLPMTGHAGFGRAHKPFGLMTVGTFGLLMFVGEWERRFVVIKSRFLPTGWAVTGVALGPQVALVPVILAVTSRAFTRRLTMLDAFDVTGGASPSLVFAFE